MKNTYRYFEDRLEDQINWYDKNAIKYKKYHNMTEITTILMSTSIPFLAGFIGINRDLLILVFSILGFAITLLTSISSFLKFHEKWQEYRTTAETLKHEKFLFEYSSGVYKDIENPEQLLVERVESLISSENSNWVRRIKTKI